MKRLTFEELPVSPEIKKAVAAMGFEEATPIQSLAIPLMLQGKDVQGQAQTGTGKTAAFGIPILEHIDAREKHVQALILCPTRELAIQVAEEFKELSRFKKGMYILPVYGGQPIERQIFALRKGVHIVIGTPGRIIDHMNRKTLDLSRVKIAVLDEADEMLDMGFIEDIETILSATPSDKQTVCFSATMSREFLSLTRRYQRNPVMIKVVHEELTVPTTEQMYFEVKEHMKLDALTRLIDYHNPKLSLVFCNTKRGVDELTTHLQARGYFAEALHGDMRQSQRDRVMAKFRAGRVELLIATDVAARGIDVENIDAVFNYDVPKDEEYYVHRIGRTGRAGKSGRAFTFVVGREIYKLRDIQQYARIRIPQRQIPSLKDVAEIKATAFLDRVRAVIEAGALEKEVGLVERLMSEEYTSLDIAAALLRMAVGTGDSPKEPEQQPASLENTGAPEGMVRLYINAGRDHNVQVKDIVGAITHEVGIPGRDIGSVRVLQHCSFADVPKESAPEVLTVMRGVQIKGNSINIELARKKE